MDSSFLMNYNNKTVHTNNQTCVLPAGRDGDFDHPTHDSSTNELVLAPGVRIPVCSQALSAPHLHCCLTQAFGNEPFTVSQMEEVVKNATEVHLTDMVHAPTVLEGLRHKATTERHRAEVLSHHREAEDAGDPDFSLLEDEEMQDLELEETLGGKSQTRSGKASSVLPTVSSQGGSETDNNPRPKKRRRHGPDRREGEGDVEEFLEEVLELIPATPSERDPDACLEFQRFSKQDIASVDEMTETGKLNEVIFLTLDALNKMKRETLKVSFLLGKALSRYWHLKELHNITTAKWKEMCENVFCISVPTASNYRLMYQFLKQYPRFRQSCISYSALNKKRKDIRTFFRLHPDEESDWRRLL